MALTNEELKTVDVLKKSGKSNTDIFRIITKRRLSGITDDVTSELPEPSILEKTKSTAVGIGKGAVQGAQEFEKLLQTVGQGVLAGIDPTRSFDEIREQTGLKFLKDEQITEMLKARNEQEDLGKKIAFGGEILATGGAGLIKKGLIKGGQIVKNIVGSGVDKTVIKGVDEAKDFVGDIQLGQKFKGAVQTGKELLERVPRFLGRVRGGAEEASIRAEKIRTSPPMVQQAIKSQLDERVINTVHQADVPTAKAYKEMVDIAEKNTAQKGGTLSLRERPEIVAGKVAENQFNLIEKQRKSIGESIGNEVKELSKTVKVPITKPLEILDGVLENQGIKKVFTKKGVNLDFSGTKFTPQERTRIQELYKLATEGGENITPRQIYEKDQLFSKLQRESRLEGIGDIIVDTEQGNMSLFRVFRDVYANTLDELSPNIRKLNREYRKFVTLTDDIENSIIKSGNFETTKNVSDAQFAQTNLRRLTSDALSASDYRAIVSEMDKIARELGYTGAKAEELIAFANELRKIYPETIPQTSFSGGIRTGIAEFAEKVMKAGAPDITDQQKALRDLIDSIITEEK